MFSQILNSEQSEDCIGSTKIFYLFFLVQFYSILFEYYCSVYSKNQIIHILRGIVNL